MSRGPDAGALLERALLLSAETSGVDAVLLTAAWERWASATFSGARHHFHLSAAPGARFDHWSARLDTLELSLRGHILAELQVESRQIVGARVELHLAALTVQDH